MSLEKKIFLICPVRDANEEEKRFLEDYISNLEQEGHKVHYPPRDTNQNDPIGYNICRENRQAILDADEVHIYFTPKSKGTLFDIGMAFMMEKPIVFINKHEVLRTEHKSFQNVLYEWDRMYRESA